MFGFQGSALPLCLKATGLGKVPHFHLLRNSACNACLYPLQPAVAVIKLQSSDSETFSFPLCETDVDTFSADVSALPCGLFSVAVSGNGQVQRSAHAMCC
jgi:hypothetical protein